MQRVHLTISGMVQGVGFRWFVERQAEALGVGGWVRNLRNGDVEVVAEGDRGALEQLVRECRQGPSHALVDEVKVEWLSATGEFKHFRTAYDT